MVEKTDIVVFTLHKSASMFIHQVCEYLSQQSGMDHFSPNSRVAPIDERLLLTDKEFWKANHGCFAPVRFYVDVPDIDDYKVILHVRDPRDVLVSMFYSYCYIHKGPVTANTGYRKETAEEGIDAFVLEKAMEGRNSSYIGGYGTGGPELQPVLLLEWSPEPDAQDALLLVDALLLEVHAPVGKQIAYRNEPHVDQTS